MDALTFDLLSNHKKKLKTKTHIKTTKNLKNTTQVLCSNINIFNSNIPKYDNSELDNILYTMIETSKNIIQHKKNINCHIKTDTINSLKKLINCVKITNTNDTISNLKEIKIK